MSSGYAAAVAAGTGFVAGLAFDAAGLTEAGVVAYGAGIMLGGWCSGLEGVRALADRRIDVDLLMVVAAVAAAILGQWRDGSLLILIFATTGALEEAATARTAAGVRALLVDTPESAERLDVDGEPITVPSAELAVGDRVLLRPGARIPADGKVIEGEAAVDESSLTGEPLPVRKIAGRRVMAGATVTEGALTIEVTEVAADSTLARLAAAVNEAIEQQSPTQLFIERFEQRYSIGVVTAALLLVAVGPLLWGWTADQAVLRTMTFLVVASPCAVVLATMPTTLAALAAAARNRVLIRGGAVLERLAEVQVMAFDKTGTLTLGSPRITDVKVMDSGAADGFDENLLLDFAAAAEHWGEHPIGRAIVTSAAQRGTAVFAATDVELIPSRGVQATVNGHVVLVGGAALIGELDDAEDGTIVGIKIDGAIRGLFHLEDEVRPEAVSTVARLVDGGIEETWLLTGDGESSASSVASSTGIARYAHSLLPHEKADAVRHLGADGRHVAYVGDGINDAAALTAASVGVSLAQRGSALAIDSADIILMDDDLHRLADSTQLARKAQRVIRANLTFALSVIVTLVTLDLTGHLPLIFGVIGHEGSSAIVALNGLRLLQWKPAHRESHSAARYSRREEDCCSPAGHADNPTGATAE